MTVAGRPVGISALAPSGSSGPHRGADAAKPVTRREGRVTGGAGRPYDGPGRYADVTLSGRAFRARRSRTRAKATTATASRVDRTTWSRPPPSAVSVSM